MSYLPKVNDYVVWKKNVEGWVYFICEKYITIETDVWLKDEENYECCSLHRNDRVLVICYHDQWNELKYVKSRDSIYED
jgi:ribosomal protein L36